MTSYESTGECLSGRYFWASDMVVVRKLARKAICEVVDDLLSSGEIEGAGTLLE